METNPENTVVEPTNAEQMVAELKEFFDCLGTPKEIEQVLYNMMFGAISNPNSEWNATELEDMMNVQRQVGTLLAKAKELI